MRVRCLLLRHYVSNKLMLLHHPKDGANSGWRKANVNGPVYIIRRRVAPRYQLLVKNKDTAGLQHGASDFSDFLHPDWGLDCQKNYVFYKVEDPAKRIRGLWFQDDREREKVEEQLNGILEELRSQPLAPVASAPAPGMAFAPAAAMDNHYAMAQHRSAPQGAPAQDSVVLNISSLRAAWHAMADDEDFMHSIMQKLRNAQQ